MPAVSAAIGAGSSIASGFIGSAAAKNAANAQVAAGQQAIAQETSAKTQALGTQQGVYQTDQAALSPYQQAGAAAVGQIGSSVLPTGTPDAATLMANDPGYAFRMQQGQQALNRAQAAGGSAGSGAAMKEAVQYGQGYASNEYGNTFNRYLQGNAQRFGQLSNVASMGQNANGQLINAGSNYANQSSNIDMNTAAQNGQTLEGIGNAQASGYIGAANAWSSALSGVGKAATALGAPSANPSPDMSSAGINNFNNSFDSSYANGMSSSLSNLNTASLANLSGYGS